MSEDVATLVMRCRAGDREAESALAAAQALQVAAVAMGDVHAARDVSQETAVRMLRGIGDLRAPERFDAWVYRIAVSEIRRAYNRGRRRAEVPLVAVAASGDDTGESLFVRAGLRAALADLGVRERTAVALRYVHDLDDDQIADAMHCRPATVRSLLSRARKRLSRHPALADHAAVAARRAPNRQATSSPHVAEEPRP